MNIKFKIYTHDEILSMMKNDHPIHFTKYIDNVDGKIVIGEQMLCKNIDEYRLYTPPNSESSIAVQGNSVYNLHKSNVDSKPLLVAKIYYCVNMQSNGLHQHQIVYNKNGLQMVIKNGNIVECNGEWFSNIITFDLYDRLWDYLGFDRGTVQPAKPLTEKEIKGLMNNASK